MIEDFFSLLINSCSVSILCFFKNIAFKEEINKEFLVYEYKNLYTTTTKGNSKNNENSIGVTLNIDTYFMFGFLLQKFSKIKFLTHLLNKGEGKFKQNFLIKLY